MTGEEALRGSPRWMSSGAAIMFALVTMTLVAAALLTGPSLDDYWTLFLADPLRSFDRTLALWGEDIRPPIFDAWATLLSAIGVTSVPLARLISNLPGLVVLLYVGRRFADRLPSQAGFYGVFIILLVSAPASFRAFGVYRPDFWQLAAFAIQIMLVRHIMFADQDYRSRTDGMLAVIGLVATVSAIVLDYGGALFGGVVAMASVLAAIARGFRRWTRSLLITLGLSIGIVVGFIAWQSGSWSRQFDLYQNWIEMGPTSAGAIIIGLLVGTVFHNPLALAGFYIGRRDWHRGDMGFLIMIGAALLASLIAIIQVDAQRRLITTSNTADIAALATALMAAAGAKLAGRTIWINALAGLALLSGLWSLGAINTDGRWQDGAKRIARMVADCPQTRVYAMSGWRLDDGSASRTARREEPVFALGYRKLGKALGFDPTIIDGARAMAVPAGPCPTLIWIEQVPADRNPSPQRLLATTGLDGLQASRLKMFRTDSGILMVAEH